MESNQSLNFPSPPPNKPIAPLQWIKENLFSDWFNSLLTIVCIGLIYWIAKGLIVWCTTQAQWSVVSANFRLFFVGRYPLEQGWRLWLVLAMISALSGLAWGVWGRFSRTVGMAIASLSVALAILVPVELPSKLWILSTAVLVGVGFGLGQRLKAIRFISLSLSFLWLLSLPIALWLVGGGLRILEPVEVNLWNGLLLTVLIAVLSIVASFPLGVLLALGRQSTMPVIRWFCILYIEIIRGLPLVGILFMAQVMLPLFLPTGVSLNQVVRVIAAFVLFSAAYLAENVRGGLQSVPRGQIEAAKALGFGTPLIIILIVLPQALRAVIPAIVGQFIGLFKDTSLVSIAGLVELMGISRSILSQPDFIGRNAEVYLFIGLIYWVFCYAMSQGSQKLEKALNSD
ncbi:amino acid ABC transporter permease [Tumidithrix elongata RA019]|uniref:Amino acid ABC transporter permease n=1 Tax=Tumidithrix elongata BACA0141 TaxID=2716417 RepID=A0AAW9Q3B3_9CYAN|nr:amino acid ABC transporter permease [Tumidithrix elongata RA019]